MVVMLAPGYEERRAAFMAKVPFSSGQCAFLYALHRRQVADEDTMTAATISAATGATIKP
jgi:hypothetical protein